MTAPSGNRDAPGERRVLLGRIVSAHGIRGEVRVESWTDPPDAILCYTPWLLRGREGEWELSGVRGKVSGRGLIVSLPGVEDRSRAEAMRGIEISVPRRRLPPAQPGEYYWVDLEGLRVRTADGVELGVVRKVLPTGANEVLEVHGERVRMLPFVIGRYVKSVDLDAGIIEIDWDPDF